MLMKSRIQEVLFYLRACVTNKCWLISGALCRPTCSYMGWACTHSTTTTKDLTVVTVALKRQKRAGEKAQCYAAVKWGGGGASEALEWNCPTCFGLLLNREQQKISFRSDFPLVQHRIIMLPKKGACSEAVWKWETKATIKSPKSCWKHAQACTESCKHANAGREVKPRFHNLLLLFLRSLSLPSPHTHPTFPTNPLDSCRLMGSTRPARPYNLGNPRS